MRWFFLFIVFLAGCSEKPADTVVKQAETSENREQIDKLLPARLFHEEFDYGYIEDKHKTLKYKCLNEYCSVKKMVWALIAGPFKR